MKFNPNSITKDHVLKGVKAIEKENQDLIPSTRWNVIIDGKPYPPKEVMRYARFEFDGSYDWPRGGGWPTNDFLEKMGFQLVDKSSSYDPLTELIKRYKSHVVEHGIKEEIYKWELLGKYSGRPNTEVEDFKREIHSINFANLIYYKGIGVMQHLVNEREERYREQFRILFNEDLPLQVRLDSFTNNTLKIYRELITEERFSHHHDERTMSTLLTYHNPKKYTFYKNSFYQKLCKLLKVKARPKGKKYTHYLELVDSFIEDYIRPDKELVDLIEQMLPADGFKDKNHLILAQDILYSTLDKELGITKAYWRIGTKDDTTSYWSQMHKQNQVSIGWAEIGDLDEQDIKSKNDILQLLKDEGFYTERNKKSVASRKAGEIYNFYQNINIGDVVLAQDGFDILGIGLVDDDYNYNGGEDFPHTRSVKWKTTNVNFKNEQGNQTTVYKITDLNIIHKVERILANTVNEGEGRENNASNKALNTILYGPPGTGKTYHTINYALEICGVKVNGLPRKEVKKLYKELVDTGQIVFTTFHQSTAYEDFIEGIKPLEPEKEGDHIIYKVVDGIFKTLAVNAKTPSQRSFDESYRKFIESLSSDPEAILELKTPTGKTFGISLNKNENLNLHTGKTQMKQGTLTKENLLKEINGEKKFIGWEGYFKGVLNHLESKFGFDKNITTEKKNYVLIIDEINRGNISAIFGELITLLEEDKRLGREEALIATLPYSKDPFGVPPNLYIIGTMNTADRSVEALDTALRRRFSFVEMPPEPKKIKEGKGLEDIDGVNLPNLLTTINNRIEKLLDKDHMIGHSYFMGLNKVEELKQVFHNKVLPLLQEYFFGDYGKIGLVLGEGFFESTEGNDKDIFAPFNDYDSNGLMQRNVYHLKNLSKMDDLDFIKAVKNVFKQNG